jgi:hypothetical protein
MGVAGRLAGDGAQAEALAGVEAARLQPPVVEQQALRLRIFEEQLAVRSPVKGVRHDPRRGFAIKSGAVEEGEGFRVGQG